MTLGTKLKELRSGLKWKQWKVAKETGLARSYISRLENDKTKRPSAEVFGALARGLRTTTNELYAAATISRPLKRIDRFDQLPPQLRSHLGRVLEFPLDEQEFLARVVGDIVEHVERHQLRLVAEHRDPYMSAAATGHLTCCAPWPLLHSISDPTLIAPPHLRQVPAYCALITISFSSCRGYRLINLLNPYRLIGGGALSHVMRITQQWAFAPDYRAPCSRQLYGLLFAGYFLGAIGVAGVAVGDYVHRLSPPAGATG